MSLGCMNAGFRPVRPVLLAIILVSIQLAPKAVVAVAFGYAKTLASHKHITVLHQDPSRLAVVVRAPLMCLHECSDYACTCRRQWARPGLVGRIG